MNVIQGNNSMNNQATFPNTPTGFNRGEQPSQPTQNQAGQMPNHPHQMNQAPNQQGQMSNHPHQMNQAPNQAGQMPNHPRQMNQAPNQAGQMSNHPHQMNQAPNQQRQMPNHQRQMNQAPNQGEFGYPTNQSFKMSDGAFKAILNISIITMILGTLTAIIRFINWGNTISIMSNMMTLSSRAYSYSGFGSYFGSSSSSAMSDISFKLGFLGTAVLLMTFVLFFLLIFCLKTLLDVSKETLKFNAVSGLIGGSTVFTVLLFLMISVIVVSTKSQGIISFSIIEWITIVIGLLGSISFVITIFMNKQDSRYWNKLEKTQFIPLIVVAGSSAFFALLMLIAVTTI